MKSQHYSKIQIAVIGLLLAALLTGCAGGGSKLTDPMTPQMTSESYDPSTLNPTPVAELTPESAVGIFGGYNLVLSGDGLSADLVPLRSSALGESYLVSGKSFFVASPCKDCFRISGLAYEEGKIVVKFSIRHPLPKGDTNQPPTRRNRLDLDIFDLALVVVPESMTPSHYELTDLDIYHGYIYNPDGYTTELANVIENPAAMPYKLVVDDSISVPQSSTFNRFEMGTSKNFEVDFLVQPGETLVFDLFLTFGYGNSAVLATRLHPKYYNPEFNRKAAWKAEVIPPNGTHPPALGNTWNDTHSLPEYFVTVTIYDWQIGANVDPALTNPNDVYATSNVKYISVEIPGMTDETIQVDVDAYIPSGTGMPDSPLVYEIPVRNENFLTAGEYVGLVKVEDERVPKDISEDRDFLIHSPDGKALVKYSMPCFRTYQTFIATVLAGELEPGRLMWAKHVGHGEFNGSTDITSLSDDTILITGWIYGTTTFGEGEINETTLTSAGMESPIIARYNSDGTLIWVKLIQIPGGSGYASGTTVFSDNTIGVTGWFGKTAIFDPGGTNETSLISRGAYDGFIARYTTDGTLLWAKQAGGEGDDGTWDIVELSDNSIAVVGHYHETAIIGGGEINETILPNSGGFDIFIARFNHDGSLIWARHASGSNIDLEQGIVSLSDDSIIITGYFINETIFGPGEPEETTLSSNGDLDIFIASINPDGTLSWVKGIGGSDYDRGNGITALNDDSVVVTGSYSESATFGLGEENETILNAPGENTAFFARYNSDGTLVWAKGTSESAATGVGVISLSDNSTIVCGMFGNSVTFGSGETYETSLVSTDEGDIFVAKFNPNGTLSWAKQAGGENLDYTFRITTLTDNSTVIIGHFLGSSTFGVGEFEETTLHAEGYYNIFIARFLP